MERGNLIGQRRWREGLVLGSEMEGRESERQGTVRASVWERKEEEQEGLGNSK